MHDCQYTKDDPYDLSFNPEGADAMHTPESKYVNKHFKQINMQFAMSTFCVHIRVVFLHVVEAINDAHLLI